MALRWPKPLKNKYAIASVAFIVWLGFIDRNNLVTQWKYRMQLHDLQQKQSYLEQQIQEVTEERQALQSSPEKLERFAREHYLMKKENEDLYLIDSSAVQTGSR